MDTFRREYTDCLEVNGFVSVASGVSDTFDFALLDSMSQMTLLIFKRSSTGSAAVTLESLSKAEHSSRFEIVRPLKACFGNGQKFAVHQVELFSPKTLPGETPTELGDDIYIDCKGISWGSGGHSQQH